MTSRADIGARGEDAAAEYLVDEGFRILHRNWRSGRYELDIVAVRDNVLHFVEVKSRAAGALTSPEEAMTRAKCAALFKAASAYIAFYDLDMESQFDLVAIDHSMAGRKLRYIPNALTPQW